MYARKCLSVGSKKKVHIHEFWNLISGHERAIQDGLKLKILREFDANLVIICIILQMLQSQSWMNFWVSSIKLKLYLQVQAKTLFSLFSYLDFRTYCFCVEIYPEILVCNWENLFIHSKLQIICECSKVTKSIWNCYWGDLALKGGWGWYNVRKLNLLFQSSKFDG